MLIVSRVIVLILFFVIPVLFALIIYKFFMSLNVKQLIGAIKNRADIGMHNSKWDFFNYDRITVYLSRYGVDYMFDSKIQPIVYFSIRFGLMVVAFILLSYKYDLLFGVIGGIIGFYMFDALIHISNDMDNEKMLMDVKTMYDSLKIQTSAGVYLTNSLAESYICVETERLKVALLDLNNKIIMKKDIEAAIDEFNLKFNNKYIDAFCIVVKQSLESGQAINALADISNQISDVQNSINTKQFNDLERKTQLIELLMFVGIVGITLFYLASQISIDLIS